MFLENIEICDCGGTTSLIYSTYLQTRSIDVKNCYIHNISIGSSNVFSVGVATSDTSSNTKTVSFSGNTVINNNTCKNLVYFDAKALKQVINVGGNVELDGTLAMNASNSALNISSGYVKDISVVDSTTCNITGGTFGSAPVRVASGYSVVEPTFPASEIAPYTVVADTDTFSVNFVDTEASATTDGDSFPENANPVCKDGYILPTPVKAGYEFVEWNTANDRSGTAFAAGDTVVGVKNETITLYAIWRSLDAETFTVRFINNDEEVASFTEVAGYEITTPTLDAPVRYEFEGWENSDGETLEADASYTIEKDTDFIAQWNYLGPVASVKTGNITEYYNVIETAVEAAKSATKNDGDEATITLMDDVTITSTLELGNTADRMKRIITFDLNGFTVNTPKITGTTYGTAGAFRVNPYSITYFIDSSMAESGKVIMKSGSTCYVTPRNFKNTKIFITGGTWTGAGKVGYYANGEPDDEHYTVVQGGIFDVDPTNFVDSGYEAIKLGEKTWQVSECTHFAETTINGITTKYETLKEAIEAVTAGQTATVKLLSDCLWDETLTLAGEMITLDLNGKKIYQSDGITNKLAVVPAGTELDITDTSTSGKGSIEVNTISLDGAFDVLGTLKLLAGKMNGAALVDGEDAEVSGEFEAEVIYNGQTALYGNLLSAASAVAQLTAGDVKEISVNLLSNVSVDTRVNFMSAWNDGVYRTVTFDFNGYVITASKAISGSVLGINDRGKVIVNDSKGTGGIAANESPLFYSTGYAANFTVNGGNYTGATVIGSNYKTATCIRLYGGTYSFDPSANVYSISYQAVKNLDDTWSVVERDGSVSVIINDVETYYDTFADAFDAANVSGQVAIITLYSDAAWPQALTTKASKITIDLNGFTLEDTISKNERLLSVSSKTEVDVIDSRSGGMLISNNSPHKNGAIIVYGTFKALGGTITVSNADEEAWYQEDVISAYSGSPVVEIDGATITAACLSRPAIGIHAGTYNYISGTINGGVKNYGDAQTLNGTFAAKTKLPGSSDPTYFNTFEEARSFAANITLEEPELDFILVDDYETSERINFYVTEWNEDAKRTINFDFNGHKIIPTKSSLIIFGINGSQTGAAGKVNFYDSVGNGGVTGKSSTLAYSSGWALNYQIYGGTYTGLSKLGNSFVNNSRLRIYGGTYNLDPTTFVVSKDHKVIDNGGSWTVMEKDYVCQVTIDGVTTKHEYVDEALTKILDTSSKQGTINIIADAVLADTLVLDDKDADIIINLDGHKLSPTSGKKLAEVKNGYLAIENGEIDFTGADQASCITVSENRSLELNDITFTGSDIYVKSSGTVLVDGNIITNGIVLQEASSASVNTIQAFINDEIRFNLKVNVALMAADVEKTVQLQYTVDTMENGVAGRETIALDPEDVTNGVYTFAFTKGLPQWSVDSDLELKVLVDGTAVYESEYTVQDYYNTLNAIYPDDVLLNTVAANQLQFAKELQNTIFGSSDVEYAGWEDEFISIALPTEDDDVLEVVNTDGYESGTKQIVSALVNVYDRIGLKYKVCFAQSGATVKVVNSKGEEMEVTGGAVKASTKEAPWTVSQSRISPLDYSETYTISLMDGDDTVHSIKYSVNSYCYSMYNNQNADEQTKNTVLALYRYGVAAAAYTNEHDPECTHHFGMPVYSWSPKYLECTASRTCTDAGCGFVQTETATATRIVTDEAEGIFGEEYNMVGRFVNPAFNTQTIHRTPDRLPGNTDYVEPDQVAFKKNLILDSNGNYGGTLSAVRYGEGAPLNGELDKVENGIFTSEFYRINDFYNLECFRKTIEYGDSVRTAERILVPHFKSYQQTMKDSDGIASALAIMNYFGETNTELDLVNEYEGLTGTTVYGHNTTAEGLVQLFNAHGYTAKANCYLDDNPANMSEWVKDNLKNNKLILFRHQTTFDARWSIIIGLDECDIPSSISQGSNVMIMSNPYDAYDHYQDGYSIESISLASAWWFKINQDRSREAIYECVVVDAKTPFNFVYAQTDDMIGERYVPEKHYILDSDGLSGGAVNPERYGAEGRRNEFYYVDPVTGRSVTNDTVDRKYYAFPDYYNMTTNKSKGSYHLQGYMAHDQGMASSCGINSTMSALTYINFQWSKLAEKLQTSPHLEGAYLDLSYIDQVIDGDKKEEGLVRLYMDGDSYFDNRQQGFDNYGGVGASKLQKVPAALGERVIEYGNYSGTNKTPIYKTYESFTGMVKYYLGNNLPIIISYRSTGGHWEVIIGYEDMGTPEPEDDVLVLADSSDGYDHWIDGYNTYPAMCFYSRWFNGTYSLGQAHIVIQNHNEPALAKYKVN